MAGDDMSDRPMGFGPTGDDGEDDDRPDQGAGGVDPMAEMFGQLLGPEAADQIARALGGSGATVDPSQLGALISQVQRMLATPGDGGPVNWQLATDVARQAVSQSGDRSIGGADRRAGDEALRLADLWLDDHTTLAAAGGPLLSWSRAEWVEGTLPVWKRLVEPVAESVAGAMAAAMTGQAPPELSAMVGNADQMMRQVGGSVFGLQIGQALAALAGEVVSGTDIGLPLVPNRALVLLPDNVAAVGEGLDVPLDELRLFLALREAARSRLFAHVPWLSAHLLGAVESYARGITIDTARIESAVRDADPTDPSSIQQALTDGMFEPERTPAQQAALTRLEVALALVEGWVEVVASASAGQLPHADALRETVRRRRATGGPAEHTFAALVGLELRPRRVRDAVTLWTTIEQARGLSGRDAVWDHPDLLPSSEDLDDPEGYAQRRADDEQGSAAVDAAIAELLSDSPSGPSSEVDQRDGDEPGAEGGPDDGADRGTTGA
jgi:putative hydrolase